MTVKDNETELLTATEAGAVEWTPAETGSHVLTHTSGDTTLEAAFIVLDTNVVAYSKESYDVTNDLLKDMGVDPAKAKGKDKNEGK